MNPNPSIYPTEVVDPHHHFIDTANNPFQNFLQSIAGNVRYLPEHYTADMIDPLEKMGVRFHGSVHVEAMPDSGEEEVAWVERIMSDAGKSYVKAFVASCDLTRENVEDDLVRMIHVSRKVRGVRWILDCVGKFEQGRTATHPGTLRHDGVDYLKSPLFERGLKVLERYNLSFDLQCAPIQLVESAPLFARYPNLKVCINHMGKPRRLLGNDLLDDGSINLNVVPDAEELKVWRLGMRKMAALPNVHVKLSMMGYAIPGWIRTPARQALLKSLVLETIDMFGVERCMVAWNWHVNAAVSDGDGAGEVGPDAVELLEKFLWFFEGYGRDDRARLFSGTAKEFYRLE